MGVSGYIFNITIKKYMFKLFLFNSKIQAPQAILSGYATFIDGQPPSPPPNNSHLHS